MQFQKAAWLLCILAPACASTELVYRDNLDAWKELRPDRVASEDSDPEPAREQSLAPDAQLADLLAYGRLHNPKLSVAFHAWRTAIGQIPQASKLPEPRILFGAFLSEVETRTGPMRGKLSISQALPGFGKRQLAGDVATARAEAIGEGVAIAYLDLDRQIKDIWYELAWLQQAVQVSLAHRDLLSHWQNVARTRLELGLSKPSEILRVELELGQLEDRLLSLYDLEAPLKAQLNAVLNRPSGAPLATPEYPLPAPSALDPETLLSNLQDSNPRLRQLQRQIVAAEQALKLADKASSPDFIVGLDYTAIGSTSAAGSGDDAVALTFGMSLPVWRTSYLAKHDGARAQLLGARSQWEATHNELTADLEMALFKLRDADRHLELLNTSLIPKGNEAIGIMGDTYQSGESSFIDVVDAQRILLEFQLQAVRAEKDRAQALSKVEQIIGLNLPKQTKP